MTNAHVISQAADGGVTVQLSDGRTVGQATIVGGRSGHGSGRAKDRCRQFDRGKMGR